jgi:predicted HicB family RNase H-like nuclease
MEKMKNKLAYYLNLNYPIEIKRIPDSEGGGYTATIPQLGKYAFVGDGESIEEAIQNLEEIKAYLFEKYLDEGIPIPEPLDEEEKNYSGKFVLRVPSELHRFLAQEAKRNGTTLNQYCVYLLTRKSYLKGIQDELAEVREEIKDVFTWLKKIEYKIEPDKGKYSYPQMTINTFEYNQSA